MYRRGREPSVTNFLRDLETDQSLALAPAPTPARPPARSSAPVAASGARHVWVTGPAEDPGRWPGVLLEWSRSSGGWQGRVAYAVDEGGGTVLVVRWVPAPALAPADR